jgi:DNA polymerase/3'-5' exonuclease PolX
MDKKELAAVLEEIALLLDDAGENPFKVRACETGARAGRAIPGYLGLLSLTCSSKR